MNVVNEFSTSMKKQNRKIQKWKIVEEITALAHRSPRVIVKKNARLPCLRRGSTKKRYREIDVLLSSRVAGHSVHFAIECKALTRPISSTQIDTFIGKLQDVGISPQTSVFVSTSGYYDSAIERASEVGIKTLILEKANSKNFPILFRNAIQMAIFMVCFYKGFSFQTQEPAQGQELFKYIIFHDKNAKARGTVLDLMRLAADRLPLDEIVTHKYKVTDAQKSIDTLKARQGIKHALTG